MKSMSSSQRWSSQAPVVLLFGSDLVSARAHLGRRSHSAIGHFFSYLQPRLVFGDVGKVSGVVAQQVVHVPQVNMNVNIPTPPHPTPCRP